MNNSGVRVKMYENEKCIYEHEIARSNENNLKMLLENLRDVQSNINNFLTTLIEQHNTSNCIRNTLNRAISSDNESVFDEELKKEEDEVNPKKCKLST